MAQREGSEVGEAAWEGGGAAEASPWSRQGGRQQGGGEEAVAELDWKLGVGRHFFVAQHINNNNNQAFYSQASWGRLNC